MWVEPDAMGNGHGRRLFEHAVAIARSLGATALELDADPNAVGFYERMGMERIGETPSTLIPGRALPRMRWTRDAPRVAVCRRRRSACCTRPRTLTMRMTRCRSLRTSTDTRIEEDCP